MSFHLSVMQTSPSHLVINKQTLFGKSPVFVCICPFRKTCETNLTVLSRVSSHFTFPRSLARRVGGFEIKFSYPCIVWPTLFSLSHPVSHERGKIRVMLCKQPETYPASNQWLRVNIDSWSSTVFDMTPDNYSSAKKGKSLSKRLYKDLNN